MIRIFFLNIFLAFFFFCSFSIVLGASSETQGEINAGNFTSQVIPGSVIDSYNSLYGGSLNYGLTVGEVESAGLLSDGIDGPITSYVAGLSEGGVQSGGGGITSSDFMVPVSVFSPIGTSLVAGGSEANVNSLLARILNALIVMFGVAAVFFMTIGAGYMIIYHGQDELLSKGKTIFMSGLIALVVALSAGLIVRLFIYLLYTS